MSSIFSEGALPDLKQSVGIIKLSLELITNDLKDDIKKAITDKDFTVKTLSGQTKQIREFTRFYCQELMFNFGLNLLKILENQDCKKDGELTNEEQVKLDSLRAAEARKKVLEEVLYEMFIVISQQFKNLMASISEQVQNARVHEWAEASQRD